MLLHWCNSSISHEPCWSDGSWKINLWTTLEGSWSWNSAEPRLNWSQLITVSILAGAVAIQITAAQLQPVPFILCLVWNGHQYLYFHQIYCDPHSFSHVMWKWAVLFQLEETYGIQSPAIAIMFCTWVHNFTSSNILLMIWDLQYGCRRNLIKRK